MTVNRSTDMLTINKAATHSGKSATTIRRWLESGSLKYTVSPEGYKLIKKDDLLLLLQESNGGVTPRAEVVQHVTQPESDTVTVLKEALEYERRRCERLETENKDLKSELLKTIKEMQATLEKQTGLSGWMRNLRKS